jgi:serine protease Do
VDGREVSDTRHLIDYVSSRGPDATVELEVLRKGKRLTKKVKLTERDVDQTATVTHVEDPDSGIEWLGIRYQDLTPQSRAAHGLPDDLEGVWVTRVAPTSPLYDQNLRAGGQVISVITEVNGQPVTSVEEMEGVIGAAKSGSRLRIYVQQYFPGQGGLQNAPLVLFPLVP